MAADLVKYDWLKRKKNAEKPGLILPVSVSHHT